MTYRLLVTGSRHWDNLFAITRALHSALADHPDLTVVHGDCPTGVDAWTAMWADRNNVPQERWPADWDTHGRAAGPIRNQNMVDSRPDAYMAFPGGAGTRHCIDAAQRAGIPPRVIVNDYTGGNP